LKNFIERYKFFINNRGKFLIEREKASNKIFNTYFQEIFQLFGLVEDSGGFEEVTSQSFWDFINKNEIFNDLIVASKKKNLKEVYQDYLFHFEKIYSQKSLKTKLENYEKDFEKLNPNLLGDINIFTASKGLSLFDDKFLKDMRFFFNFFYFFTTF